MLGGDFRASQPCRLHYRYVEDIVGYPRKTDIPAFRVGNGLVGEYPAVYELLHLGSIDAETLHRPEGVVVFMPYDSEEKMVGADAVAAGPHGLIPGVIDYAV